jgi:hypothetical protein
MLAKPDVEQQAIQNAINIEQQCFRRHGDHVSLLKV